MISSCSDDLGRVLPIGLKKKKFFCTANLGFSLNLLILPSCVWIVLLWLHKHHHLPLNTENRREWWTSVHRIRFLKVRAKYPYWSFLFHPLWSKYTHQYIWKITALTSLTLLIWQYARSCFCREHNSSCRWAGWLFSDDDVPSKNLSLFFSSSPNAWS